MVRLLECQKQIVEEVEEDPEHLRLFGIALICHLLDIFESDLVPDELRDMEHFTNDWCK